MKVEFKGARVPILQLGFQIAPPAKNTFTEMADGQNPVKILMKTWELKLLLPFCQAGVALHVRPGKRRPQRLLTLWLALAITNYAWEWARGRDWGATWERTYYQGLALFVLWLTQLGSNAGSKWKWGDANADRS